MLWKSFIVNRLSNFTFSASIVCLPLSSSLSTITNAYSTLSVASVMAVPQQTAQAARRGAAPFARTAGSRQRRRPLERRVPEGHPGLRRPAQEARSHAAAPPGTRHPADRSTPTSGARQADHRSAVGRETGGPPSPRFAPTCAGRLAAFCGVPTARGFASRSWRTTRAKYSSGSTGGIPTACPSRPCRAPILGSPAEAAGACRVPLRRRPPGPARPPRATGDGLHDRRAAAVRSLCRSMLRDGPPDSSFRLRGGAGVPRGRGRGLDGPGQAAAQRAGASAAAADAAEQGRSLKFGVLGDFGTGKREQYELAEQMARVRAQFPFELVLTVGDNLYGGATAAGLRSKFEKPYKPLLDAGVKFYASLGNHDAREQRYYKLFNMDGKLYYTFKAPKQDVRFFALESAVSRPGADAVAREGAEGLAARTGRFPTSITRSTRRASGTARICHARRRSSRCSSSTTSASSSPDTTTSTSASSRRTASSTSWSGRAGSCARGTSTRHRLHRRG